MSSGSAHGSAICGKPAWLMASRPWSRRLGNHAAMARGDYRVVRGACMIRPLKATGLRTAAKLDAQIDEGLGKVAAIDEDRILRLFRAVVKAMLRTNAFAPAANEALAFKLDSAKVPGLPAPLPWREIFVYSPAR